MTSQNKGHTWSAYVDIPKSDHSQKRRIHLGSFSNAEDAARVVDRAHLVLRGRNAKLNFPVEDYDNDAFMMVRSQFN